MPYHISDLTYNKVRASGYEGYLLTNAPLKALQFGEGNFLRAFADCFFDIANEEASWNGKIALVQPIEKGLSDTINAQEGLYTLYLRGIEDGKQTDKKRLISVVSGCYNPYLPGDYAQIRRIICEPSLEIIISNTTEAGIVYDGDARMEDTPPCSFPAKLTALLYERFRAGEKGLIILSCELIDHNGAELLRCCRKHVSDWGLGEAFDRWLAEDCVFCSTLVDRIVPGRITDEAEIARLEEENGYHDALLTVGEVFGVWYIEGDALLADRLPFAKTDLPVHVVPDVTPYKMRKVRILNGAHTGFVPGAYLAGFDIVRDAMHDDVIASFLNRMLYEEIIPTIPLPQEELQSFAERVRERFLNPYIDHALLSITLNSVSKWRTRNLPSMLDYIERFGKLPACLTMSLAACLAFYSMEEIRYDDGVRVLRRADGVQYQAQEDAWVLDFFHAHRDETDAVLVCDALRDERMWGQDLTRISGLEEQVTRQLRMIREQGARDAFAACVPEGDGQ